MNRELLSILVFKTSCLVAATVFAAANLSAAADPVFPPASGVGLEPPPGMHVATGFQGFQNGLASILIVEFPKQAYPQIEAKRADFAAKFGSAKTDDVTVNGVRGFFVKGTQTAQAYKETIPAKTITFRKFAIVLDGANETTLVTAQAPEGDNVVSDAQLEAALHTIVLRDKPDLASRIAALPFTVGDQAGFRPTLSAFGASLGLTEGPLDEDPEIKQPRVVVASSLRHTAPDVDRLAFAKATLASVKSVKNIDFASARLVDEGGTQYAEIEASGTEGKHDVPVAVSYFMRFGDRDYFEIVGVVPIAERAKFADRFRQVALSVRPKA